MSFDAIPILDFSLSKSPETKPAFLASLRSALLNVGFLYIKNTDISPHLIEAVIHEGKAFFNLPEEQKLEIQMKNKPSFLGYNLLGTEITAHRTDHREQLDLSTPHPLPLPTDPNYYNLRSPNQWPSPSYLPSFQETYSTYITAMSTLSQTFTSLIAESLLLSPAAFDHFFDRDQQHKLKIVKYPPAFIPEGDGMREEGIEGEAKGEGLDEEGARQGVGPHKDSMTTSYLLQVPPHKGLQALNLHGDWIDCPPIPGTLVVAIGQGLEALTRGVCKSTTHRVLSPLPGSGPRYSVPFFQGVSYDAEFEAVEIPKEILDLKEERETEVERSGGKKDEVEFTFVKGRWRSLGEATLWNRVKSHPDVGERWYPEILGKIRREQAEMRETGSSKEEKEEGERREDVKSDEVRGARAIEAH